MNLSDLSKIDIKDIDVAKLKDKAVQHKEVVAQGVLVLTSIVVAIMLVNQSQFEIGQFKFKIATLQAKTGAIDEYNSTQNAVKKFLDQVPAPVPEDKIISLVTDYAGQNNVRILTFTPAVLEKKNTLETTKLRFTLTAESFASMVRFMSDIERGKDFMQVWSCEVEPQQDVRTPLREKKPVPVNFRIEVASLRVIK